MSTCLHTVCYYCLSHYFCLKSRLPFEPTKWHNTLGRRRSDRKDDIYVLHTFDMLLFVGFLPFIYDWSKNSSQKSAEIQAQLVFKLKVSLWFLKSHFFILVFILFRRKLVFLLFLRPLIGLRKNCFLIIFYHRVK